MAPEVVWTSAALSGRPGRSRLPRQQHRGQAQTKWSRAKNLRTATWTWFGVVLVDPVVLEIASLGTWSLSAFCVTLELAAWFKYTLFDWLNDSRIWKEKQKAGMPFNRVGRCGLEPWRSQKIPELLFPSIRLTWCWAMHIKLYSRLTSCKRVHVSQLALTRGYLLTEILCVGAFPTSALLLRSRTKTKHHDVRAPVHGSRSVVTGLHVALLTAHNYTRGHGNSSSVMMGWFIFWLDFHSQFQNECILPTFDEKCMSDAAWKFVSVIIFHLTWLWKAKFFTLCDEITGNTNRNHGMRAFVL